ncbi:MAG: RIP metalloprotease RseP [Lactovum sp.]
MFIKIIAFIFVFSIIVCIHEYGHMFFAKRAGVLVLEFAIGMGPKIFSHRGKDGTYYNIRLLPVGGYVRMAGWSFDDIEIKKGTAVSLQIENEKVKKVNLSERLELENSLPLLVTEYDFENKLYIKGEYLGEEKSYEVDSEATVIEEDGTELRITPNDRKYASASVLNRILINLAGPVSNFILGLFVFILINFMQAGVPSERPVIGTVYENYPAMAAGLKSGDLILEVNAVKVESWTDLSEEIHSSKTKDIQIKYKRDNQEKEISILAEKSGNNYVIGITPSLDTGFLVRLSAGFKDTFSTMTLIVRALGELITQPDLNDLGGPVAIFEVTGQAASLGMASLLSLLASLSINIGIFNLLPIPFLDGGRILLVLIEWVRKKPLAPEKEQLILYISAIFLIILMLAVTWNDIMRAFIR